MNGNVKIVDGTGFSMPETKNNIFVFPRHSGKNIRVGFPVGRIVAVFSLATGSLIDLTIGPWKGKGTGESSLLQNLWPCFSKGETLLGDGLYSSFWVLSIAQSKGIHVVTEFQKRSYHRLCKKKEDQSIWLEKPRIKPQYLSQEEFDSSPKKIKVRIIRVHCAPKGFRPKVKYILTTHLNKKQVLGAEIVDLYKRRWQIEVNLKHLKTTLGLDILKGKNPEMIKREVWAHMLAYNIIRMHMAQAGLLSKVSPDLMSFHLTQQVIAIKYMFFLFGSSNENKIENISKLITELPVKYRPNRYEPRALKRRKKNFAYLSEPRELAKNRLYKKFKGESPC